MKNWKKFKLSDVCDTQYGFTTSATDEDTGTRFLRITDIAGDRLNWETVPFCEIEDREKAKYLLKEGDIVVARTGATVGFAKQMRHGLPNAVFASYLVRLTVKSGFDKRFIGCLVESTFYKDYINAIAGGAAQPNANAQDLVSLKLTLPPLPLQTRIAQILSRYDRLIENCEQQIAALEATARQVYREWFVRGRGPGGAVEEWEEGKFTDFIKIHSGGTPKTDVPQYWDGDINWFSPADASESFYVTSTDKTITEEGLQRCNSKLYPKNTVVITARGTVGKVVLLGKPMAINQSNYALIGDGLPQSFVFFKTLEVANQFKQVAIGAVFDTITIETFERTVIKFPRKILNQFDEFANPILNQILLLQTQITHLRRTRDTLLPRLLSGQLTVTEAS